MKVILSIAVIVLAVGAGIWINLPPDEGRASTNRKPDAELERQRAYVRQINLKYFKENEQEILAQIVDLRGKREWSALRDLSAKYLAANNDVVSQAYKLAVDTLAAEAKSKRVAELQARLFTIPAEDLEENRDGYQALVSLEPDNEDFAHKLAYYQSKIDARDEAARKKAAEAAEAEHARNLKAIALRKKRVDRVGEPPVPSAWDGTYHEVERYLKSVANDPDSIEMNRCTKAVYSEEGWIVACEFFGRNAFNAKLRKQAWFTINHGRVVAMRDAQLDL